eukprot:Em0006g896a
MHYEVVDKDDQFTSEENRRATSSTPLQFDRDYSTSHEMNTPVSTNKDSSDAHPTSPYHGRPDIELQKRQRAKEIRIDPRGRGQFEGSITDQLLRHNNLNWVVVLQFSLLLLAVDHGVNMAGWISVGIDYTAMFDFVHSSVPTPHYFFSVAGLFSYLYAALIGLYLFCRALSIGLPLQLVAGIMWASLLLFVANPLNSFLRKGRLAFLLMLGRICLSPLYHVHFGDFWLPDQLCSTTAILLDLQYVACFSRSNVGGLLRHREQAATSGMPAKYCTTFPVVFFATAFSVKVPPGTSVLALSFADGGWIVVCLILFSFVNAAYTFFWDVYFDWAMVDSTLSLRSHRLYRHKWYYYFAMVLNFVLRFSWTIKLTVILLWWKDSDLLYTALTVAEIFRRFVWNFFRVELEQVSHSIPDSK